MEFENEEQESEDEPIYFFGTQSAASSIGLDELSKVYIDQILKVVASIFVVAYSFSEFLEEVKKYRAARKVNEDLD